MAKKPFYLLEGGATNAVQAASESKRARAKAKIWHTEGTEKGKRSQSMLA
jgi:hypothetical protein